MRRSVAALASRRVYVAGVGVGNVTRKKEGTTIAGMASEAVGLAVADAQVEKSAIRGVYVGNMLSGMLSKQQHLGPLVATASGLDGGDALTCEACCGAGGGALRVGYAAVKSGLVDFAVVVGVEHMTHREMPAVTEALAAASHWGNEGSQGATFVTLNGTLMDLYLKAYPDVSAEDLAHFAINAHKNGLTAPHATLKKALDVSGYSASKMVSPPIRIFDASPVCDGSAAVVLTSERSALRQDRGAVEVLASGTGSDVLTVRDRAEPLRLRGVELSTNDALARAGVTREAVDVFELHDAYSIMGCLSLEAAGFAPRGEGTAWAKEGRIGLHGDLPVSTFGGLKARGHPVGATGVYQAAEMFLQLTQAAGANQAAKHTAAGPVYPQLAMTQNIGGAGSSVFTHLFGLV
eukprot:TRINITY_DN27795_c0_g1_i1.p1 TRINITY_DN27795_c0_g1~~TRINITY_DN27795_c0_g1_i1.p1  ORF type:complete len:406 (+),score=126.64 TRINITY_DN27795_c0_g1_i1:47-1264(+)